jgi:hypothetical protein
MVANHLRDVTASHMPKAFLLQGKTVSQEDDKLSRFLEVLGVDWQAISIDALVDHPGDNELTRCEERLCVLGAARVVSDLLDGTTHSSEELPSWMTKAESIYVYGFLEDNASQTLLRTITDDPNSKIRNFYAERTCVSISADDPEVCGPMSGLQFYVASPGTQSAFDFPVDSPSLHSLVSSDQGALFVAVHSRGAHFFLNSSPSVVDVLAPCASYFDVKEHFFETVPILMWLRWACRLHAPMEISACLIVDDPPLKPRYGFLNYRELLAAMHEHNFATTVAFIPWNWNRTDSRTVELFREHPDKLSLCVHGCDHTASEFAEQSTPVLNKRIKVASHRMQRFTQRTLLPFDATMVFPQGAFSSSAVRALKINGFTGAVNTPVSPLHKAENKTTLGDLLRLAIMKYADFPLFTRRYAFHGVENFAFDGLLGKPCLIASHHGDFANDSRVLLELIARLNSLRWKLRWRPLGEVIRQACIQRRNRGGDTQVEMYGSVLDYQNSRDSAERATFVKLESDADKVNLVTVNGEPVDYVHKNGYLRFEATVPPNDRVEVRIVYSDDMNLASSAGSWKYQATAIARRYLSEFRDNYLSRNAHLQQRALKVKQALGL